MVDRTLVPCMAQRPIGCPKWGRLLQVSLLFLMIRDTRARLESWDLRPLDCPLLALKPRGRVHGPV